MQAEKVAGDLRDAHDAVAGAQSPVPLLSATVRRLERRAAQAPALIEPAVKALDAALTVLDDARRHLDAALHTANHDPSELEKIEERLFALRAAARKHNVPVDALNALAARYAAELGLIDAGAERLAALEEAARAADAYYREAAAALSRDRKKAAETLDRAVNDELKPLKLGRAKFVTEIVTNPEAGGPHGIDRVEFYFSANIGEAIRRLAKVASGGEASRLMLVLKTVAGATEFPRTIVFDEIDSGIGGRVSEAVGIKLKKLSETNQVFCVTHQPQIARFADSHLLVRKEAIAGRTEISVDTLDRRGRVEEIARMLTGAEITETARRHARELLKG